MLCFFSAMPLTNDLGVVLTTSNWHIKGNDRNFFFFFFLVRRFLFHCIFLRCLLSSNLSKQFTGFVLCCFVLPPEFVSRFKPSIVLWIRCFNISFVVGVKCLSLALNILFVQSLVRISFALEDHFCVSVNYVIYFHLMIGQWYYLTFIFWCSFRYDWISLTIVYSMISAYSTHSFIHITLASYFVQIFLFFYFIYSYFSYLLPIFVQILFGSDHFDINRTNHRYNIRGNISSSYSRTCFIIIIQYCFSSYCYY